MPSQSDFSYCKIISFVDKGEVAVTHLDCSVWLWNHCWVLDANLAG